MATVPPRKRPLDRKNRRVTIEVYEADEELWRRARAAAALDGTTLRELVQRAVLEYLARRDVRDAGGPQAS